MDVVVAVLPLVILIYMMTKKKNVPSHIALPVSAALVYVLHLVYAASDPNLTNATVLKGALAALTPISIIWGAVLLTKTMQLSGAGKVVRSWLFGISSNRVAQLMVIGWAFAFMIEGASGFGTPAAVAAPVLVGLGFEPIPVALLALVMNSVPVSFGAVGTPTWFGMGQLGLDHEQLLEIGLKSAFIHSIAALVIPIIALSFVVNWKEISRNLLFVYLSILSCVVPYGLLASVNYEFPALVGGAIGFVLSIILAKKEVGLATVTEKQATPDQVEKIPPRTLLRAFFPVIGTILLLIVTRIPELGIKDLLNAESPSLEVNLGSLGGFSVSAALVLKLSDIFRTESTWVYKALFVPALIPFFVMCAVSIPFFRLKGTVVRQIWSESLDRMKKPIITLIGALIMVELLMVGGDEAQTMIIGKAFAEISGTTWQYVASFLGALGSFFSGSATVSNLTFSGIQDSIAQSVGLDRMLMLSLQSVGASMGNMVCINNIIAVCSILGVYNQEGFIIKRTVIPMALYGIIAAIIGDSLGPHDERVNSSLDLLSD
jgi:lactate permease